jgi:hypothetical protein
MFFLDPVRGRRRRGLVRDQIISFTRRCGDFFDKALRDAQHRIEGTIAETSASFRHEQVDDDVLVERVRSKIGRHVSHPRAIEVSAHDGHVVLSGAILRNEVPGLLSAVWGVRGVLDVEDRTTPHTEAGNVSDLQGGRQRWGDEPEILQANWAPATRLFMGGIGTWLLLGCLARRNLASMAWGTIGFGLLLNSMSHCSTSKSHFGAHNGRRDRKPAPLSTTSSASHN